MNRASKREINKLSNPQAENRMTEDEYVEFLYEEGMSRPQAKIFAAWHYRRLKEKETEPAETGHD